MPDRLGPEQRLYPGQALVSMNQMFSLALQPNGDLILARGDGAVLWATQTAGLPQPFLNMQGDGNLVLYGAAGPAWFTRTEGWPGSVLILQDDGNLVLYAADGRPLWNTGTNLPM